jgi:hypothetical protein
MPEMGFELTITASERAKIVHASDHSAIVTGLGPTVDVEESEFIPVDALICSTSCS